METLEEMIDEYEAYGLVDNYNSSMDTIIKYLKNEIAGNNESFVFFNKNYKDNKSFLKKIKEIITNPEKYEKTSKIIGECQMLTILQNKYLETLLELIDDNNLKEIAKLVDFLSYYYQESIVHLERQLYALDDIYNDFFFGDNKYEQRQVAFNEFMEHKINELKGVKSIEKSHKI